ncbi:MAG: arylsulfotransferase family protein [Actinomycetota bacterium]|nr:arylsulfotransferase family protein [Rubrobacteraceae bacterium]MDQ3181946.1 arylsulfotransferase family protein [Actinomycetota bacterium]
MNPGITRKGFLQAAAGAAALVAFGGTLGCDPAPRIRATATSAQAGQVWSFRSRPDLHAPVIEVNKNLPGTAPGYIFIAAKNGPVEAGPGQDGCMILDNDGQPVWLRLLQNEDMDVMDFKAQTYKGETVLTWWEGQHTGYGQGEYVICDHSYREIKRVRAGNGFEGDHHEFLITPEDTALITIYNKVPWDYIPVGDNVYGKVLDGIAQEVDIETGEVLLEWHSLEHVGLEESYTKPYDYFHINSIEVYDKDHLLISSRTTSTVYKVDRKTGEVVWRLGGKNSDFEMGQGTRTTFQHDARRHPDGTITIFDNGNVNRVEQSRGIAVEVDEDAMIASLAREYTHPDKVLSATQGSVQVLPNGNVLVGWGSAPLFSEFDHDGELIFSAAFPTESETYRAFRFPWSGQPTDNPAIVAELGADDEVTIYASWNGATEVATWQVLAGAGPDSLEPLASAPRKGFETVITLRTTEPYIGLKATNGSDRVLGTTRTIKLEDSA